MNDITSFDNNNGDLESLLETWNEEGRLVRIEIEEEKYARKIDVCEVVTYFSYNLIDLQFFHEK